MSTGTAGPMVVIVGAGFGGLRAAKMLAGNGRVNVTLIDKKNHHLFQPLLYQVATAGLSPADIAVPIRTEFAGLENISVILAEVNKIDLNSKTIIHSEGKITYDYLILACGATHSYFSHPEWEEFAPGLKTLAQATEIRRRILTAFERAEIESDAEKKNEFLTFVIVGAGPTGVELAGAIAEISRKTLNDDFRKINPAETKVFLIEAGPRILPQFNEKLAADARRDLEAMGVHVRVSSLVTEISSAGVSMGTEKIKTSNVLWAAGVKPSPLGAGLGVPLDKIGRVTVENDLSLKAHPEVFVIGDLCSFKLEGGKTLPGLAPVAMQQGKHSAAQVINSLNHLPRETFSYVDKGQMATIGRSKAILENGDFRMHGFFAWLAWLVVHIYYLIGFKNKFFVFLNWSWSYITFKRGARLIVGKDWREP